MTYSKDKWNFSKTSLKLLDASLRWHDKSDSTAVFGMMRIRGFTLVELAVVLVVLSILVTAAIPNIVEDYNRTRTEMMIREVESISSAARLFAIDHSGAWPKQANGCQGAVGKPGENGTLVGEGYLKSIDDTSPWASRYNTRCDFSNRNVLFAIEVKSDAKWAGLVANTIHATELYTQNTLNDSTRTHLLLPGSVFNENKRGLLHRVAIEGQPELNQMNTTLNMTSESGVRQNIDNAKDVLALNNVTAQNNVNANTVVGGVLKAPLLIDKDDFRYRLDPSGVSALNAFRSYDGSSMAMKVFGAGSTQEALLNSSPVDPNGSLAINDAYIRAGFKGRSFWLSSRALRCNWSGWTRCDGNMFVRILWFEPHVKGKRWTTRFYCESGRITHAAQDYCRVS